MSLNLIGKRAAKKLTRRIGSMVGASVATYISISPEHAAQLEAAIVLLLGIAVDFGMERIAALAVSREDYR